MNRYGSMAKTHWRQWLPKRYAALGDGRDAYFTQLGEQVEHEIQVLTEALIARDAAEERPGDDAEAKVGRRNMARFNAESDLIRELVLIDPEPDAELELPDVPEDDDEPYDVVSPDTPLLPYDPHLFDRKQ